ncbi:unnamed protein product [Victoria cruziana]
MVGRRSGGWRWGGAQATGGRAVGRCSGNKRVSGGEALRPDSSRGRRMADGNCRTRVWASGEDESWSGNGRWCRPSWRWRMGKTGAAARANGEDGRRSGGRQANGRWGGSQTLRRWGGGHAQGQGGGEALRRAAGQQAVGRLSGGGEAMGNGIVAIATGKDGSGRPA